MNDSLPERSHRLCNKSLWTLLLCLSSLIAQQPALAQTGVPTTATATAPPSAAALLPLPLLPPQPLVLHTLGQLPQVRAAASAMSVAAARSQRLQVGPHEWVAKVGTNRRRDIEGTRWSESEIGLETAVRWPGKVALDRSLGAQEIQLGKLTHADAWHEAARTLLADWFDALREIRAAQLLQEQDALMVRQIAVTQQRVNAGEAAMLELLAVRAERARVQAQAQRAHAQALLQRTRLQRRYPDLTLPLPTQLAAGAFEVKVDVWPEANADADAENLASTESASAVWVQHILADNHELELAQAKVEQAHLQAQRAHAQRHPDPTVGVRATRERGGQERVLGVYLSLPLGSAGLQADALAAQAQVQVAEQEAQQVRQRVENLAWENAAQAAQAHTALKHQRQALQQLEQTAALQERAYALGESSLMDLLQVQRHALEARLTTDTAALDALQAQARLRLEAHLMWPEE